MAVTGGKDGRAERDWNNGKGCTRRLGTLCSRQAGCDCVGGCGHWQGMGSMAAGHRGGPAVGAGVGVPTATLAKDERCVGDRHPGDLSGEAEAGTWI